MPIKTNLRLNQGDWCTAEWLVEGGVNSAIFKYATQDDLHWAYDIAYFPHNDSVKCGKAIEKEDTVIRLSTKTEVTCAMRRIHEEHPPFTHDQMLPFEAMTIDAPGNPFHGNALLKLHDEYIVFSNEGHPTRYVPGVVLKGTRMPAGTPLTFIIK